jgi:hypothetical protein
VAWRVVELASGLDIGPRTIWIEIETGRLQVVRGGERARFTFIRRQAVEAWLQGRWNHAAML